MVESLKLVKNVTGHFFFNLGLIIFFLLLKLKAAGGSRTFDYGTEKGGLVSGGGHWHLSSVAPCPSVYRG